MVNVISGVLQRHHGNDVPTPLEFSGQRMFEATSSTTSGRHRPLYIELHNSQGPSVLIRFLVSTSDTISGVIRAKNSPVESPIARPQVTIISNLMPHFNSNFPPTLIS